MHKIETTPSSGVGHMVGFERIRRITGYLVGTMDKWNDAKRSEEADRVGHPGFGTMTANTLRNTSEERI